MPKIHYFFKDALFVINEYITRYKGFVVPVEKHYVENRRHAALKTGTVTPLSKAIYVQNIRNIYYLHSSLELYTGLPSL